MPFRYLLVQIDRELGRDPEAKKQDPPHSRRHTLAVGADGLAYCGFDPVRIFGREVEHPSLERYDARRGSTTSRSPPGSPTAG